MHTLTRVVNVSSDGLTFEHQVKQEELKAAGIVWTGGVKMSPLIEHLDAEKNKRGLLIIKPTLQLTKFNNVFALGDIAIYPDATPTLAGTAQLAFQEASLAARNVKAFLSGEKLQTKHFEELGEAISLGTERAAVLTRWKAFAVHGQASSICVDIHLVCPPGIIVLRSVLVLQPTPRPFCPLGFERCF